MTEPVSTIPAAATAQSVPVLPLRDVVVYPHMVIPLFVGREKSIQALDVAMRGDKRIMLIAQKQADVDDPKVEDLYRIGTIATILQLLKLPDGTVKVLVEGVDRARIDKLEAGDYYSADVTTQSDGETYDEREMDVLGRSVISQFEQYVKLNKKVPPEVLTALAGIDHAGRLADTVAAHMSLKLGEKQKVLEILDVRKRLEHILVAIEGEMDVLQIEKRIRGRVKAQMEKSQREYYLNEQMKAIQKELGEMDEGGNELTDLEQKIAKAGMPKEAREKAGAELNKLKMMSPMSAEATVVRNYIDWLVKVPWKKRTKILKDIAKAESVLDEDHFGLEKVKERIVEYLAVQHRVEKLRGPILCLVGPPGVGKTSLGQSIARATNRKFVRMSLGGVRDEAEIRGHRRTYIGSMPGKIVQNMAKAGVHNPLFLLDEVDKMSMDFRGDPSSALLEVLDPEQNATFNDHYLEVDLDLSEVMFVCTANTLNIPGPLLDRMEVIRLPGYTEDEKMNIGRRYLVPKQMKANGLRDDELKVSDPALLDIVRHYTREAGVRNFEREIAKIGRKSVKQLLLEDKEQKAISVTPRNLEKFLGVKRFRYGKAEDSDRIGQVTGLAWTEVGGELLTIEAAIVPGKGKLQHTGHLGEVMQESIQAAMTVVRSRSQVLGLEQDFYQKNDIHLHMPEGATPKDGPSAGVGMCTALVSALTRIAVKSDVAMTGEITLRGEVLPIGGLKEKLLAAHRGGIKTVLIPDENVKDLTEIPDNIKGNLNIRPVKWIDEVLQIALVSQPVPLVAAVPVAPVEAKPARRAARRALKPSSAH
ncbi:MAG TPA: endopeptidase La [Steroidobacteraceae bacterium]|jgi:ATP-dependent Lon protease|nr:endopeptidase La [Steroidobacteraceae bacterium]